MAAEVFEEVAYSAYCDACEWQSEIFETRSEAMRAAEAHDETCPFPADDDGDAREEWLARMGAIVEEARVNRDLWKALEAKVREIEEGGK